MLLFDAPLTFREFTSHEEVPLASIFREALELLATRDDRLDLHRLLRAFPALRAESGEVADRLRDGSAPQSALATCREIVAERVEPDDDDAED